MKISTQSFKIVNEVGGLSRLFEMEIDAAWKHAYISNLGSNNFAPYGEIVSIVDIQSPTIKTKEINTGGIQPSGFAISKCGKYGFVSNYNTLYSTGAPNYTGLTAGQGTVNVIDLKSHKLCPITINVGVTWIYFCEP